MDPKEVYQKALLRLEKEKKCHEDEIHKIEVKIGEEKAEKAEDESGLLQYLKGSLDETRRALSDVNRNINEYLQKLKDLETE